MNATAGESQDYIVMLINLCDGLLLLSICCIVYTNYTYKGKFSYRVYTREAESGLLKSGVVLDSSHDSPTSRGYRSVTMERANM